MPPTGSMIGIDWLNQNEQRNFPLADDATMLDTSGSLKLPTDFIVDLVIPISEPANYDPTLFHLLELAIFSDWIMLKLGYNGTVIGFTSVSVSAHTRFRSYFVQGVGDFLDSIGKISIGSLDAILKTAGQFTFDAVGARILPTRIRPDVAGIRSISTVNSQDTSSPIDGVVHLIAGDNIKLTPVFVNSSGEIAAGDPNGIRVDAISGEGLNEACGCDNERDLPPCIRTINGQGPTEAGAFNILGDDCVVITPEIAGLIIDDTCATPCCGSVELETLRDHQDTLNVDIRTQLVYLQRLESSLAQLSTLAAAIEATGLLPPE